MMMAAFIDRLISEVFLQVSFLVSVFSFSI